MEKGVGLYSKCIPKGISSIGLVSSEQLVIASGLELGKKEVERLMEQLKGDKKIVETMFCGQITMEYNIVPVVILKEKEYNDLMSMKRGE